MKFYFAAMLVGLLLCLAFLLFDAPGSKMGWGVGLFGALLVGPAIYNKVRYGSIWRESLNDKARK
ncbi:hypothetical protein [Hymenobacter sp. 102]|uniref:hypothetical protein n=1 Tax=Hymenobacter sp. 102 TaxID=3403152 RepID=UPI003CF135AE